jgi:GGDEF domain-containing protein/CBS domain-containing protein
MNTGDVPAPDAAPVLASVHKPAERDICDHMDHLSKLRRFVFAESGTAMPEYALVVSAVVTVTIAAVWSIAPHIRGVVSDVAGGPLQVANAGSSDEGSDVPDTRKSRTAVEANRHLGRDLAVASLFLTMLVAVLASGGWVVKDRKRRTVSQKDETPKKPKVEKILQTRLSRKRDLLWRQLVENYELLAKNRIEVRHVMTRDLVVIRENTSGKQMESLFRDQEVSYLLVCDANQRLVGVVDVDDHQAKPDAAAAQIKTAAPPPIASNTLLGVAIAKFIDERVYMLPVVDGERLCGILTPTDLVLTMQCSLQLWARATTTVRESVKTADRLDAITGSMRQDLDSQEQLVGRIHSEARNAVRTGKADSLLQGIDQLAATVNRLSNQLTQAREEVRRQKEEASNLKEPEVDELTGVATRRELDMVLRRMLAMSNPPESPLTVILVVADGYTKLRGEQQLSEANNYLKSLAQWLVENTDPSGLVARMSDDRFLIALPQTRPEHACQWSRRLAEHNWKPERGEFTRPRVGIACARRGEENRDLLARVECVVKPV